MDISQAVGQSFQEEPPPFLDYRSVELSQERVVLEQQSYSLDTRISKQVLCVALATHRWYQLWLAGL